MSDALSNIDFFGVDIRWNYKGSDKQKTLAGTIMTVIFFGLTLYSIIIVGLALFRKEEPEVTKSILFDSDPKRVTISPEDFSFAVGLQDPHNFIHFVDETIYQAVGIFRTQNRTQDPNTGEISYEAKSYNLELGPCTLEHFGKNSDDFSGLALSNLLCPTLDLDVTLELEGVWESPTYSTIDIMLYPCVNSTKNGNHCKPQEKIDYWLEGAYFVVHYADSSVDPENHEEPKVSFRNSFFGMISSTVYKDIYFYIKNIDVVTDTGILFDQLSSQSIVSYDKAFETSSLLEFENQKLLLFRMKVSSERESYQRRYPKIAQILAEISGILETYILAMVFVITPIQRFLFYQKFIQESFTIDKSLFSRDKAPKNQGQVMNKSRSKEDLDSKKYQKSGDSPTKGNETAINTTTCMFANIKNLEREIKSNDQAFEDYIIKNREVAQIESKKSSSKSKEDQNDLETSTLGNLDEKQPSKGTEGQVNLDVSLNETQQPIMNENQFAAPESKVYDAPSRRNNVVKLFPGKKKKRGSRQSSSKQKEVVLDISQNRSSMQRSPARFFKIQEVKITPTNKLSGICHEKKSEEHDEVIVHRSDETERVENVMKADESQLKEIQIVQGEDKELAIEEEKQDVIKEIEESSHSDSNEKVTNCQKNETQMDRLEHRRVSYKTSEKQECKITLCEYIMSFFGSTTLSKKYKDKRKMYDVGFQEVENIFDVHNYYRILKEIELIKGLLLKSEEMKVFDEIVQQKRDISEQFQKKIRRKNDKILNI